MATAGGGGGGSEGDLVGWPNKPVSVLQLAREPQPEPEPGLKCPRCDSTNTKFCYFNNCSFSQPRHFCRACRHYWTRGGDLRNIPVGGGSRKSKRGAKPMDTTGAAGGMSSRSATSTAPSAATTSTCTGSATAATTSTCTGSATTAVPPDGMHQ